MNICACGCGKLTSKTWLKNHDKKGKPHSALVRDKIRMANIGQIPWNKGLSVETDERVAKYIANMTISRKGKGLGNKSRTGQKRSEYEKRMTSIAMKLYNPLRDNLEVRKKHKEAINTPERLQVRGENTRKRNLKDNPMHYPETVAKWFVSCQIQPNRLETDVMKYLNDSYPNQWKFIGDGSVLIGNKAPDFIRLDGPNQLIEVNGDYWHRNDDGTKRIAYFKERGYNTFILKESDFRQNRFTNKLQEFINAG